MDTKKTDEELQKKLSKPFPNPYTGKIHIIDEASCFADEETAVNYLISLGFEPYAVTNEPDMRKEVLLKAGAAYGIRHKKWFKRERLMEEETK